MNGVRALTVKYAANGNKVQCSFLSDRSLSKHLLHNQVRGSNFALLYVEAYVIDVDCGSFLASILASSDYAALRI